MHRVLLGGSFPWDCVWQSTVILIVGLGASAIWRHWPARAHRILLLAMVACLVTPLLSQAVRQLGWGVLAMPTAIVGGDLETEPASRTISPVAIQEDSSSLASAPVEQTLPAVAGYSPETIDQETGRVISWSTLFGLLWMALSAFVVARLALSLASEARILARARPLADTKIQEAVEKAAAKLGLKSAPRIYESDRVRSPVIWCWGRCPRLFFPSSASTSSSPADWDGILCHELAHWKRRDHLAELVGEVLLCVFPWQPLAWWGKRLLRQLSERACDDWVLAGGQSADSYAESLLGLLPQNGSAFALSAVSRRNGLQSRIRSILQGRRSDPRPGRRWACGAVAAMVCLVTAFAFAQTRGATAAAAHAEDRGASPSPAVTLRQVYSGTGTGENMDRPVISRDGKYVSYVQPGTEDLDLLDIATGKKRTLSKASLLDERQEQSGWCSISPDCTQVAYAWYPGYVYCDLCVIGIDGSNPRILLSGEENKISDHWPYEWSPDGKRILTLVLRKNKDVHLLWVSVEDGSVQLLKDLGNLRNIRGFDSNANRHSPDGRYIAFELPQQENVSKNDIFLLDTEDNREIPLVKHLANDKLLGWSPDGKWILLTSNRTGTWDAWLIRVADGRAQGSPKHIKADIGEIEPMGFTQEGSFYYHISKAMTNVYIATFDPETRRILGPPTPIDHGIAPINYRPVWSPDGEHLAYNSRFGARGTFALCTYSLKTGEERELLSVDSDGLGQNSWSPDGRSILLDGFKEKGGSGFYQIDVQTGNASPLVLYSTAAEFYSAEWSANGKAIYYNRYNEGETRDKSSSFIVARDLMSGKEKELLRLGNQSTAECLIRSPDGNRLAFIVSDGEAKSASLRTMPVSGGECHELLSKTGWRNWSSIGWTPDDQHILFVQRTEEGYELCRISAKGGEPETLWSTNMKIGYMRVNPDGRGIAFSSNDYKCEVWAMENFLPTE